MKSDRKLPHADPTTKDKLWLVHGPIKTHPLSLGMAMVREFLSNTREIVVWGSHQFNYGFDKPWPQEAHDEYRQVNDHDWPPISPDSKIHYS